MSVKATAAICSGHGHPFELREAELDELRSDEVLVRVVASGICHTDLAVRDAQLPVPVPIVLGHEGAGIVEAVGSAVTAAARGDRVIMSFNSCGRCPSCDAEAPTYCYNFFPHNWSGVRADGSPTMRVGGDAMNANFFGQSSFATRAIAHQRNVTRVPDEARDVPLSILAPIGCGLMTGAGAVLRSMKVRPNMPVAVFGVGTVGLAAVMAAKIAGAYPIIAIDLHQARLDLALELGATHALLAGDDIAERIREVSPAGLGYVLDTTGRNKIIEQAWDLLAPKGIVGIVGASDPADNLTFNEARFMSSGRTVMAILGGDSNGSAFLNELIGYHLKGQFPIERLVETFPFEQINEAIAAGEAGRVVKPVLVMGEE